MIIIFIIVAAGDGGEGGVINMNIINIYKKTRFHYPTQWYNEVCSKKITIVAKQQMV